MRKYKIAIIITVMTVLTAAAYHSLCWAQDQTPTTASATPQKQQNFLFKLTHFTDNLHAVMMTFGMANGLLAQGQKVTILLVMDGAQLANKSQPLNLQWGNKEHDLAFMYDEFMKNGGKIYACPSCSNVLGIDASNLRPGITLAEKGVIPTLLIDADKVIDY